jgi:hypothetical protein
MLQFITVLKQLPWIQGLGALMALMTALHVFFLALVALTGSAGWAVKAASITGIVAVDIGKAIALVGKLLGSGSSGDPPAGGASVGRRVTLAAALLFAVFFIGCASLQSGAAAVCQFIDSGNPIIGALCLSTEEAASAVQHTKASRAAMKLDPAGSREVDICSAPLPSAE